MKLLIVQLPPFSRHLIPLRSKYSSQNPTINRILKFFEGSPAGSAEAYTTVQLIKHIKQFIFYLIRYGLRNFCKFLTKINLLAPFFQALDDTDSVTVEALEPCVAYVEQKEGSRNVFSNYTSRSTTIDYISSLIESTNASSYEDFQRKIDSSVKIQLLKQLGSQSKSLTIQLVKIYNLQQKMKIRQTHYLEFIRDVSRTNTNIQHMYWLEEIFIQNNVSIPHFLCSFLLIQTMYYQKINTLLLKGPTNTGKSMLLQLLLAPMQPTTISREKDRSSFHLDQLPNSTSIIFEEPYYRKYNSWIMETFNGRQYSSNRYETQRQRGYLSFRAVFWVVLPCKMIVDRRFRGTCCLHHQG
jgi:hypothetical protein